MTQLPRTTLIVTTYEWPAALDLTLKSTARQSVAPDEVIVADDGSGHETARVVERWRGKLGAPLTHIWQPHEGFRLARSRNRAIAAASGEYLLIVDGDMVLHRHFVSDHLHAARRGSFIQGVRLLTEADVAARMLREGALDLTFFSPGIRRRRHTVRSLTLSRLLFWRRTGQRAIRGCNQAYWKSDLQRVNGFNEAFVGWGREDNEIAARLYNAGVRRRNLKFQALAIHLHHPPRQPPGVNPNDVMLYDAIKHGATWCSLGLDRHTAAAASAARPAIAPQALPDKVAVTHDLPVRDFA
ncbi:MAG TPA: glycosyltransferase family 2 protein [Steroidobacteraceae bacterium]|nr:glycosyltransferase family 2 protein [Steroidobacteraceae bacterium]